MNLDDSETMQELFGTFAPGVQLKAAGSVYRRRLRLPVLNPHRSSMRSIANFLSPFTLVLIGTKKKIDVRVVRYFNPLCPLFVYPSSLAGRVKYTLRGLDASCLPFPPHLAQHV